jgi:hypothetical protein
MEQWIKKPHPLPLSFEAREEVCTPFYQINYNLKMNESNRTKCLVYTRVMGYLSPTYRYNVGKKSEFYSRKYFNKMKAANHDFVMQYGTNCGSMEFSTGINLIKGVAKPAMATVSNSG